MNVDKWFNKQSTLIKVILLILPFVGWVVDVLVRLSLVLRTKDTNHIIGLVLFILLGYLWFPTIIDLVFMLVTGKLFLTE